MKKSIFFLLLIILCSEINGQWYTKKYNVQDINLLSRDQLDSSLKDSKDGCVAWLIVTGSAGAGFLVFKYLKPGMGEDPGFFAQLLGDEGVNKVGQYVCVLMVGVGIVGSLVHLSRCEKIKSVLRTNFPPAESLRISPALIPKAYARTFTPGISFSFRF